MTMSPSSGVVPSAVVGGAAQRVERSFLRHVIPLRLHGPGSISTLYRHAFIHREALIRHVLGALETVQLPALPRMLLAEGFQLMLEGQTPQRDIRALFEEAEMEARRIILQVESPQWWRRRQRQEIKHEIHYYAAIQSDPLTRLLAYELRAACGYYAQLMAISSKSEESAAALLRTLIATDIRTDSLLMDVMLRFEGLQRDLKTGERLEPVSSSVDEFVKECLLVERDAFGRFRFDARGDNRHLLHSIKLGDITKTPRAFAVVLDPVIQQHGNFCLEQKVVHQGRWVEYRLSCNNESHRVDQELPDLETVGAMMECSSDCMDAAPPSTFLVRYNDPICRRHKETVQEKEAEKDHVEVFELAVEDTGRSFWERWFLDR